MERTGKRFGNNLMRLVLLGGLILQTACSVKEDRIPCPCILHLDFVCPETEDIRLVGLKVTSLQGYEWRDTVDVTGGWNGYSVPVPQSSLHVSAWAGDGGLVSESGLAIPYGYDCPRVFMHDSDIRIDGEYYHETVNLRKNHCVLTLVTEGEDRLSSVLRLKGNVVGYDAWGVPLNGDFSFVLEDGGSDEGYTAVLPRQTDASLMLEVDDGSGNNVAFAIGQYIMSSGYDWTSPDLDDISVTLDYALTEIRVVIGGWESVFRYDVEI